jgi:hypothetical protein
MTEIPPPQPGKDAIFLQEPNESGNLIGNESKDRKQKLADIAPYSPT